jgi:hypothetical protein
MWTGFPEDVEEDQRHSTTKKKRDDARCSLCHDRLRRNAILWIGINHPYISLIGSYLQHLHQVAREGKEPSL